MTNNDLLYKIHTIFDHSTDDMIKIFKLAEKTVTSEQVGSWVLKVDDEGCVTCDDENLESFLNGYIVHKRGPSDKGLPGLSKKLNNNIILNKLKIALNLKAEDLIKHFQLAGLTLSKHEISAFFRKPGNKHYKACTDQTLECFMKGVTLNNTTEG
ncbi:DUF1456 family protein [Pseudoalteromonas denitrificans]|uniref:Uncharacterized conserved protein YehS, DUF1456 family n=1 Tax=Pseudoalteromonas denitrificans DSM 6059 TaxID=1123010 RepID=A0A1I1FY72_9GAMM|nr:DUF1456 family protein [Pseudoalteromonas denitrificans]SFC01900.1 Uncharacterized conserved protein YehS, DUF1456 family [Pseudoalteromonas denitrificans DSM 6059]